MSYRICAVLLLLVAFTTNARAKDGERIALCIGIDKYDDSGFEEFEYAEHDVTEFADVLRGVGYKVVLMTTTTGKTDLKLAPTKKNLDAQIEALIQKRNPDDLILIAFVGHGLRFDKDAHYYFCPVDAKPSREKTATLVSLDDLYVQFGRSGAGSKVLLTDCSRATLPHDGGPNNVLDMEPPKGVLALFACSPNERSHEHKELKHGVFFYHVLEGCKTANTGNNEIEFLNLAKVVIREVPKTVTKLVLV